MTKGISKKQAIIPISLLNAERIIVKSNKHFANINRALKNIKFNIVADFIYVDNRGMVIITNKVAANSDLDTIEKYIENVDEVDTSEIMSLRLPQYKSYLKILGISYYVKASPKSNIAVIWVNI